MTSPIFNRLKQSVSPEKIENFKVPDITTVKPSEASYVGNSDVDAFLSSLQPKTTPTQTPPTQTPVSEFTNLDFLSKDPIRRAREVKILIELINQAPIVYRLGVFPLRTTQENFEFPSQFSQLYAKLSGDGPAASRDATKKPFCFTDFEKFSSKMREIMFAGLPEDQKSTNNLFIPEIVQRTDPKRVRDANFNLQNEAQLDRFFRFFDKDKSTLFLKLDSLGNKSEFQYTYDQEYPVKLEGSSDPDLIWQEGEASDLDSLLSDDPKLRAQQIKDLCFILQSVSIFELIAKFDLHGPFFDKIYEGLLEKVLQKAKEGTTEDELKAIILGIQQEASSFLPAGYVEIKATNDAGSDSWYFKISNCDEKAIKTLFKSVSFLDGHGGTYMLEKFLDPTTKHLTENFGAEVEEYGISDQQRKKLIDFINGLWFMGESSTSEKNFNNYFKLADLHSTGIEGKPVNRLMGETTDYEKALERFSEIGWAGTRDKLTLPLSNFKMFFRRLPQYDFFFNGDRFPKMQFEDGPPLKGRFVLSDVNDLANFFHLFTFGDEVELPWLFAGDEEDQTQSTPEQASETSSTPKYVNVQTSADTTSLDTWAKEPFVREEQKSYGGYYHFINTPITRAKKWGESIFVYTKDPKYAGVRKAFDVLKNKMNTIEDLTEKEAQNLVAKVLEELAAVGITSINFHILTYSRKRGPQGEALVETLKFRPQDFEAPRNIFVDDFEKIFTLSSEDFSKIRNSCYRLIQATWHKSRESGFAGDKFDASIHTSPTTKGFFVSLTDVQRTNLQDFLAQTPVRVLFAEGILEEDEYLGAFFETQKRLEEGQKPLEMNAALILHMKKVYGGGEVELGNKPPFAFCERLRFGRDEIFFDMVANRYEGMDYRPYEDLVALLAFFRIKETAFPFLMQVVSSCFDSVLTFDSMKSRFLASRICTILPAYKIKDFFVDQCRFKNHDLEYLDNSPKNANLTESTEFEDLRSALNLRGVDIENTTGNFDAWYFNFAEKNAATLHGFANLFTSINQFFFKEILDRTYPLYSHVPGMLLSVELRNFQEQHLLSEIERHYWPVLKTKANDDWMMSAPNEQASGQPGLFHLEYVATDAGKAVYEAWNNLLVGGTDTKNVKEKIAAFAKSITAEGCNYFASTFGQTYRMTNFRHVTGDNFPALVSTENANGSVKLHFDFESHKDKKAYQYRKLYSFFDFFRMNSLRSVIPEKLFDKFFGGDKVYQSLLESDYLYDKLTDFFKLNSTDSGRIAKMRNTKDVVTNVVLEYLDDHSLKDLVMEKYVESNRVCFTPRMTYLADLAKSDFNGVERTKKAVLSSFYKPLYVRMLSADGEDLKLLFEQVDVEGFNNLLKYKGFNLEADFKLVQKSPQNSGPSGLFFSVENLDSFFYYFGYTLDLPSNEDDLKVVLGEFGLKGAKSFAEIALSYVVGKINKIDSNKTKPIVEANQISTKSSSAPRPSNMPAGYSEDEILQVLTNRPTWNEAMTYVEPVGDDVSAIFSIFDEETPDGIEALAEKLEKLTKDAGYPGSFRLEHLSGMDDTVSLRFARAKSYGEVAIQIWDLGNFFRFFKAKEALIAALEEQRKPKQVVQDDDDNDDDIESDTGAKGQKPGVVNRAKLAAEFFSGLGDRKSKVLERFLGDIGVKSLSEIKTDNIEISVSKYDQSQLKLKIDELVQEIKRLDVIIKGVNDSLESLSFKRAETENTRIANLVSNRASAIILLEGTLEEFYKDKAPEDAAEEISQRYKKITSECYTPTSYRTRTGQILGMTQEQEEAMTLQGKGIIAAGAGSGKTRVIAGRVVWLLKEYDTNLSANQILATSFTKKASEELIHRINKFGREYDLAKGTPADQVRPIISEQGKASSFGTTHSVTIGVLKALQVKFEVNDLVFDDLLRLAIQQVLLYPDRALSQSEKKPDFAGIQKNLLGVAYQDRLAKFNRDVSNLRTEKAVPNTLNDPKQTVYMQAATKLKKYWEDTKTAFQVGTKSLKTAGFDYRFVSVYPTPSFVWKDKIHDKKKPDVYRFMDYTNSASNISEMQNKLQISNTFSIDYIIYKPLNRWYNIGSGQILFKDAKDEFTLEDIVKKVRFDYYKKIISEMYQNLLSPEQAYYEVDANGLPKYTLDEVAIYAAFVDLRFNEQAFLKDLSFDDILVFGARALLDTTTDRRRNGGEKNLDVARRLYKHIMVDEAQDLNFVQHVFFDLLAGYVAPDTFRPYPDSGLHSSAESFVFIGDDKQAIYEFRGADPSLFVSKSKMDPSPIFQGAPRGDFTTKLLVTNFRSGSKIVTAANKLISQNKDQIHMQCTTAPANGGGNIYQKANVDILEYGLDLAKEISEHVNAGGKFEDYGVITRKNSELTPFILALESALIPTTSKIDLYDATDFQSPFRKFYVWFDFIGLLLDRNKYSPSIDKDAWDFYLDTIKKYIIETLWMSTPTVFAMSGARKISEAISYHAGLLSLKDNETLADFLGNYGTRMYALNIADANAGSFSSKSKSSFVREPGAPKNMTSSWQATSDLLKGLDTYLTAIKACVNFASKYSSSADVTSAVVFDLFSNLVVVRDPEKELSEKYHLQGKSLLMKNLYETLDVGGSDGEEDSSDSVVLTQGGNTDLDATTLAAIGLGGEPSLAKEEIAMLLYAMLEKILKTETPFSERIEYFRKRVAIAKKKRDKDDRLRNVDLDAFDSVLVDTGHQWKGLEAKYILAYMDDTFPVQESTLLEAVKKVDFDGRMRARITRDYAKLVRAERRLAYVFLTRGQQEVRCLSKTSFCSYFLTEASVPFLDAEDTQKVPLFIPQEVATFKDPKTKLEVLSGFKLLPMDSEGLPVVIQMQVLSPENKNRSLPIFTENFMEQPESFTYKMLGADILFQEYAFDKEKISSIMRKALANRRAHLEKLIKILEEEKVKLKKAIESEDSGKIPFQALKELYIIKCDQVSHWGKLLDRVTLLTPFSLALETSKNTNAAAELDVSFAAALNFKAGSLKTNLELVTNLRKVLEGFYNSSQIKEKLALLPPNLMDVVDYFLAQSKKYTQEIPKNNDSLAVFKRELLDPLFATMNGFLTEFLTQATFDPALLLTKVRSLFFGLLAFETILDQHLKNYLNGGGSDTDLKLATLSCFLGGSTLKDPPSITVPAKIYVNVFGFDRGSSSCLIPNVDFTPDVSLYESFILASAADYMKDFFRYFYKIFFVWLRLKPNDTNLSQITNKPADKLTISVSDLNSAAILRRLQTIKPNMLEVLVSKFRKEYIAARDEISKMRGVAVSQDVVDIQTVTGLFDQKEFFCKQVMKQLEQAVSQRAVDFQYGIDQYGNPHFTLLTFNKPSDVVKEAAAKNSPYSNITFPSLLQNALRNHLTYSFSDFFTLGEIGGKNPRRVIRIEFDTFFGIPAKTSVRSGTSPYTLYGNIERYSINSPIKLEFNAKFAPSQEPSSDWMIAEIVYNVPTFQEYVQKTNSQLAKLAGDLEAASLRLKGKSRRKLFKSDFLGRSNPSNIDIKSLLIELPNKVVFGQEGRYVAILGHYETLLVSDKTAQAPQGKRVFLDTFLETDTSAALVKAIDPNLSNLEAWISSTQVAEPDLVLELPDQVSSDVYAYLAKVDQKLLDTLSKYKSFPKEFQKKLETNANSLLEGLSVMLELDLVRRELRVRNQVASVFNVDPKTADLSIANQTSSLFDKFARGSEINTVPVEISYSPAIEDQLQKCVCVELALKDLIMVLDAGLNTLAVCSISNIEKVSGTKQDFTLQDYVAFYPPRSNPPDLDFVCLITPNPLKMNNQ